MQHTAGDAVNGGRSGDGICRRTLLGASFCTVGGSAQAKPPVPAAVVATDRSGAEVTASEWAKSHADRRPDLVLGLGGEPFYLLVSEDGTGVLPYALKAECTHLGCLAAWDLPTKRFACPCHGSQYDPEGRVLRGPAPRALGLAKVNVREADNKVELDVWGEDDFRASA